MDLNSCNSNPFRAPKIEPKQPRKNPSFFRPKDRTKKYKKAYSFFTYPKTYKVTTKHNQDLIQQPFSNQPKSLKREPFSLAQKHKKLHPFSIKPKKKVLKRQIFFPFTQQIQSVSSSNQQQQQNSSNRQQQTATTTILWSKPKHKHKLNPLFSCRKRKETQTQKTQIHWSKPT